MVWTRKSLDEPFAEYRYIEWADIDPLVGRSPRYVSATNELFFTRLMGLDENGKKRWGIWAVRNVTP